MSSPSFLIVRLSAIGDCVMASYAATAIRNKYPDAKITWAIETRCSPVVELGRLVDDKAEFPRDRWKKGRFKLENWREQVALYRRLRAEKFDIGIDLQGHSKTAIIMAMAKPKRKVATAATDVFARRVSPVVPGFDPKVHTVERYMQVVRSIGDFELPERPIMPDVSSIGAQILSELGSPSSLITIATAAGQMDKAWPIDRWNQVAPALIERGHSVVFVGGPGDPQPSVPGAIDKVGRWSLTQTIAALAASRLVLCGDTGAGHIAGAYGRPLISVFGPTDPDRFRPYSKTGVVIRNGKATENTEPAEVLAKAWEVLDAPLPN